MLGSSHISQHILQTFSCLGRQQNGIFLRSFERNAPQFIGKFARKALEVVEPVFVYYLFSDNIAKIQVNGAENEIEGRHAIVNLFFWINDGAEMETLLQNRNDEVSTHIMQVLKIKKHVQQMYGT